MVVAAHPAAGQASRRPGSALAAAAPAPTPTVTAPQGRAISAVGGAVKAPGLQF